MCAMLGVGNAIFYTPKDKKVHAENAHKAFHRGNLGDHIALLSVYNGYKENGSSSSWCYENFVQVRHAQRFPISRLLSALWPRQCEASCGCQCLQQRQLQHWHCSLCLSYWTPCTYKPLDQQRCKQEFNTSEPDLQLPNKFWCMDVPSLSRLSSKAGAAARPGQRWNIHAPEFIPSSQLALSQISQVRIQAESSHYGQHLHALHAFIPVLPVHLGTGAAS